MRTFVSSWSPVERHVKVALPRLFIHNAPAAILLLSTACGVLLGIKTDEDAAKQVSGEEIPTTPSP